MGVALLYVGGMGRRGVDDLEVEVHNRSLTHVQRCEVGLSLHPIRTEQIIKIQKNSSDPI